MYSSLSLRINSPWEPIQNVKVLMFLCGWLYFPSTLIPFLQDHQILVESSTLFRTDSKKVFWKVSKMGSRKCTLMLLLQPALCSAPIVSGQFRCNSLFVYFQESAWQRLWMISEHSFRVLTLSRWNVHLMSCSICGPTSTPAVIFSIERRGNVKIRYLKQSPTVPNALTNCFIRPSFMCRCQNIIFFCQQVVHVECWDHQVWGRIMEANNSSPPNFLSSSAVPHENKTWILCVSALLTKKKCHHFNPVVHCNKWDRYLHCCGRKWPMQ